MVLAVWRILYTHTHKPDSPSPAILSDCTTENISTELLANSLVVAITRKHFRLQAFTGKDTYTVYVCHVLSTNLESDFGWQKVFTSTLATNADKQREKKQTFARNNATRYCHSISPAVPNIYFIGLFSGRSGVTQHKDFSNQFQGSHGQIHLIPFWHPFGID